MGIMVSFIAGIAGGLVPIAWDWAKQKRYEARLAGRVCKDTLVQELYNGREPEDSIETEDGAWYGRYPLEDGDLVGAILYEDTDGGISGTFFEDADELAEAWDELGEDAGTKLGTQQTIAAKQEHS